MRYLLFKYSLFTLVKTCQLTLSSTSYNTNVVQNVGIIKSLIELLMIFGTHVLGFTKDDAHPKVNYLSTNLVSTPMGGHMCLVTHIGI
jgi:hypothetical protein